MCATTATAIMYDVWREPRCLVSFSADGKLAVNDDTLKALDCISVPLVVVSVVGPYRTGKSYLMNRLAATKKGFLVDSSLRGCTKGIWIWCRPHPTRSNFCLVLMDSEGLADCERTNNTDDTYIFSLTLLLSSTLVYNCTHALDKTALDSLHFVTVAADHIKVKSNCGGNADEEEDSGMGLQKYFPVFVVAIRDFTLELKWKDKPVTEDQYLECVLQPKNGISKSIADYNLPRDCIRAYFPVRKCFVFPSPVADDRKLKSLEKLSDSELSAEFRQNSNKFIQFIYGNSEPKKIDVSTLTGRAFAGLTRCYVEAIAKGSICVESAVETTARAENEKVAAEALAIYQTEFRRLIQFPTETVDEMSKAHDVCQKQATEHFLKHCICDYDNKYKQRCLKELQAAYKLLQAKNIEASYVRCTELLKQLSRPLTQNNYMQAGGYKLYMADIQQMKMTYDEEKHKGIWASEKWSEFMSEQSTNSSQILQADQSITGAEKAIQQEKSRKEEAESRLLAARKSETKMKQALDLQQRSFRQEIESMRQQMEEDNLQRENEFKKQQEAREAEYARLLKEGLAEKARLQQETIRTMRIEKKKAAAEVDKMTEKFENMIQRLEEDRRRESAEMKNIIKNLEENLERALKKSEAKKDRIVIKRPPLPFPHEYPQVPIICGPPVRSPFPVSIPFDVFSPLSTSQTYSNPFANAIHRGLLPNF